MASVQGNSLQASLVFLFARCIGFFSTWVRQVLTLDPYKIVLDHFYTFSGGYFSPLRAQADVFRLSCHQLVLRGGNFFLIQSVDEGSSFGKVVSQFQIPKVLSPVPTQALDSNS